MRGDEHALSKYFDKEFRIFFRLPKYMIFPSSFSYLVKLRTKRGIANHKGTTQKEQSNKVRGVYEFVQHFFFKLLSIKYFR